MPGFIEKVRRSYNAFKNPPEYPEKYTVTASYGGVGMFSGYRDSTESVLAPILTRMAMDASSVAIHHVRIDEHGAFVGVEPGPLNDRLSLSANIDQTARVFIYDAVLSMLSEGSCAVVPVDVLGGNPKVTGSYDILSLRVGYIEEWRNRTVVVSLYNKDTGQRESIEVAKTYAAIVYNPLSPIMNEPNSTLRRLQAKLALLDASDSRLNSPNLDLILQLPFPTRGEKRQKQAEKRIAELEKQLLDSQYGVAYVSATEKITQLNRPTINTLPGQVEYLTETLYSQLGLTPAIFDGTASESEYLAYQNRTIAPILNALIDSMKVAFLTKTAITQGQDIMYFINLFKMASLDSLAKSADLFGRNAILTSNEFRAIIGRHPVKEADAGRLRNKNLNASDNTVVDAPDTQPEEVAYATEDS